MAKYEDTPLTNFPDAEDNWARMSDLTSVLLPVALEYNRLWEAGQIDEANALLDANPKLKNTIFNADKWNKLRDAVIAIQRYYLEDVEKMIEEVAQNTVGIKDNPTEAQKPLVAYSARKTEEVIDGKIQRFERVIPVTFTVEGWTGDIAPFTQTVNVEDIVETDKPELVKYWDKEYDVDGIKAYNKAFGRIADGQGETGDKTVTWTCNKKPAIDITIGLKNISAHLFEPVFENANFNNVTFGVGSPSGSEYYGQIDNSQIMSGDITVTEGEADTLFVGKINKEISETSKGTNGKEVK